MKKLLFILSIVAAAHADMRVKIRVTPFCGAGMGHNVKHSGYVFTTNAYKTNIAKTTLDELNKLGESDETTILTGVLKAIKDIGIDQTTLEGWNKPRKKKNDKGKFEFEVDGTTPKTVNQEHQIFFRIENDKVEPIDLDVEGKETGKPIITVKPIDLDVEGKETDKPITVKEALTKSQAGLKEVVHQAKFYPSLVANDVDDKSGTKFLFVKKYVDNDEAAEANWSEPEKSGAYVIPGVFTSFQVLNFDNMGLWFDLGVGIPVGSMTYKYTQKDLYALSIKHSMFPLMGMCGFSITASFGSFFVEGGVFAAVYKLNQTVTFTKEANCGSTLGKCDEQNRILKFEPGSDENKEHGENRKIPQQAATKHLTKIINDTETEFKAAKDQELEIESKIRPCVGGKLGIGWNINKTLTLKLTVMHFLGTSVKLDEQKGYLNDLADSMVHRHNTPLDPDAMDRNTARPSMTFVTVSLDIAIN